jgi:Uma2 family endonuclease
MDSLTISLSPVINLTDEQFFQICRNNSDLRFERNAQGELTIMAPEGSETGIRSAVITTDLTIWNRRTRLGYTFGSSTGFKLPNGSERSPDAAWIRKERWDALTREERSRFAPICPDFVVELMSPSDILTNIQTKMQEYQDNGTKLGWLIDRGNRQVEIYRIGQPKEVLHSPNVLSGEDVLPDFVLSLDEIW